MALDWVQSVLQGSLGFAPFPATLNVRPETGEDLKIWQMLRKDLEGIPLEPPAKGFCNARLFRVKISKPPDVEGAVVNGAVLVPEVTDYPQDKIEIVAATRLKDELALRDGDQLTLEFVN
jgi:CTP-dependent riboflavin kinase